MKTRKSFIVIIAIVILVILAFGVSFLPKEKKSREEIPVEPIIIFTATDLHYISPELTDHGEYFTRMVEQADGKVTQYSEELIEAFIQEMIEKKPDVLVLSGDLTFNGAEKSHRDFEKKLKRMADAGITVLVIPGNHDLNNPMAASFHGENFQLEPSINEEQFENIYGAYGYEQAVSRDTDSLSYVVQAAPDLRILMLDVNGTESPGSISRKTIQWLGKQLNAAEDEGCRVLTVSHQNVLAHNSEFTEGFMIGNGDVIQKIYENHSVICNLSGHMHIQHIAKSRGGLTEIVTSSLAVSPNQYGVLKLSGNQADYHTEQTDVSAYARLKNLTDPNLLEFADYSRRFFRENSLRQANAELGDSPNAKEKAEAFADVNADYFAGRLDMIDRENVWVKSWTQVQGFSGLYIKSILDEGAKDHSKVQFGF